MTPDASLVLYANRLTQSSLPVGSGIEQHRNFDRDRADRAARRRADLVEPSSGWMLNTGTVTVPAVFGNATGSATVTSATPTCEASGKR
jgi:hypothetical protein